MSLRDALRKAAGLLVELPPEEVPMQEPPRNPPQTSSSQTASSTDALWAELEKASKKPEPTPPMKTVAQIVREEPGPNLDQISVAAHDVPPLVQTDGSVDFTAIYRSANLPAVPFTSEQIMEMFAALPPELPIETRRQMVKVSINAMGRSIGATPENIVADASRKLAALTAYTDQLTATTTEYVSLSQQKIARLEQQITETRGSIEAAQAKLANETTVCIDQSHKLDEVLEFFSLDVPPSTYAASDAKA